MRFSSEIPWERYALVAELARRFEANRITLGKTVLQKIVFLLQRVFGIDCDYAYTLYTYGPYCADVARDLDIVEGFGGVLVKDNLYGGYEIQPGSANDELRRRGAEFLGQIQDSLDQLIADYGRASAKDLELRSTIIYMANPGRSNKELIRLVHDVKPHFSTAQIEAAYRELDEKGYLHKALASAQGLTATN